jgi:hypothetical protein
VHIAITFNLLVVLQKPKPPPPPPRQIWSVPRLVLTVRYTSAPVRINRWYSPASPSVNKVVPGQVYLKQDRKCTYNVTLRSVSVTTVAVGKQRVLHNLNVSTGSIRCNAYAPYCHLWPAPFYKIFPHFLINGTIFEKMLLNIKCVFLFPL